MKDWIGNSKSIYTTLGASNHTDKEREENDFYATDPKAIDDLLKYESFNKDIWECACGKGHLSEKLKSYGYNVYSTDLINRGYGDSYFDFLSPIFNPIGKWKGDIITNPPYKYCTEFILKALDLIDEGNKVAMFLKLQTLEGQDRYKHIYKNNPPIYIYIYSKRIQCAKNGEFTGQSAVAYAWFIWKKGFKGDPTIKWIE